MDKTAIKFNPPEIVVLKANAELNKYDTPDLMRLALKEINYPEILTIENKNYTLSYMIEEQPKIGWVKHIQFYINTKYDLSTAYKKTLVATLLQLFDIESYDSVQMFPDKEYPEVLHIMACYT